MTKSNDAPLIEEKIIPWIQSRRSIGNLSLPAPTKAQLEAAVGCAITAPDHKKLHPWRFIITQDDARHQLGDAMIAAAQAKAKREGVRLDEATLQKTRNMPLRAPVIITVITCMQYHEKVPHFEQLLSTGAAVQNLILALKSQGYDTVWRTGPLANEFAIKSYFNVAADDYVAAFVYVGSSACDMPDRKTIDTHGLLSFDTVNNSERK